MRRDAQLTVQELIDQYEVVLDGLLIELGEIAPAQTNEPVQELEDQRCIDIVPRNRYQVDILMLDVAEGGGAKGKYGGADLRIRDDLDSKDVGESRPTVLTERPEDEILSLLIED